jgi:putative hydrolase of HD superfamily
MSERPTENQENIPPQISELIGLLTDFQKVERGITVPGTERAENDSEHSYNLSMAAWFIIDKHQLALDLEKVLKYCLVHDWPEIYAGDAFALDPKQVATKDAKEQAARKLLAANPVSSGFSDVIEEYELLDNDESRFVYSLDKLMAALTVLQGSLTVWKDFGLKQPDWEEKFRAKIELSHYTAPYLEYVIAQQKQNPQLFAD